MNNTSLFKLATVIGLGTFLLSCGESEPTPPPLSFEESLQLQLIEARPGDVIQIPAGVHELTRSLSLTVNNVTLRGDGMDRSILSFKNQQQGAEGLLVSANNFVIEDLAIEDTVGDALKINESNHVTIRRVRTEWTGGPLTSNGSYGIYPVQSHNVLIDGSVAIGASDAGIYVGQSSNIIVRNSRAEFNVAGIEIENSTFADVHDNEVTNNTGGILVFDLPDLPIQGGRNTRVYNNRVFANNTDNFAPIGNIVASVPAGSGLIIMANDNIEIFGNQIADNDSANLMMVSYLFTSQQFTDPNYDPFPEQIHIHDNTFTGGGTVPDNDSLLQIRPASNTPIPDIVWDGVMREGQDPKEVLCLNNNGDADFANLDFNNGYASPKFDINVHQCNLPPLSAIQINSGGE